MLFHVGIEFLDIVNFIFSAIALVAHEPMGFLLGQPAELVEGGLHKYLSTLLDQLEIPALTI